MSEKTPVPRRQFGRECKAPKDMRSHQENIKLIQQNHQFTKSAVMKRFKGAIMLKDNGD